MNSVEEASNAILQSETDGEHLKLMVSLRILCKLRVIMTLQKQVNLRMAFRDISNKYIRIHGDQEVPLQDDFCLRNRNAASRSKFDFLQGE